MRDGGAGPDLHADLDLAPGASCDLVLALATGDGAPGPVDVDEAWAATADGWRRRVPALSGGRASRDVGHSRAVLHGLTSSGGGMVAAATLGLPERAERARNYDYRFAWVRDQCYAGHAAALAGDTWLLDSATSFVAGRLLEHGRDLAPAYTVDGGDVPEERDLDLPGYPGARAVAGNWVRGQTQLDAFGEALLLLAQADELDRLDPDGWRAAQVAVDAIGEIWQQPDAGIWELDPAWWAHSRLTCAAGLRALALRPRSGADAGRWSALADRLVAETGATCLHPTGRWQRTPDDARVDAALLLPGIRGALPAGDPRTSSTLHAVLAELTDDGYCYRFRHGDTPLARAEGAFLLCGFLVSLALLEQGDRVGAGRWFERSRAACGTPGLYAEELDTAERQLRGNVPQAFVHALMVETACRLETALG